MLLHCLRIRLFRLLQDFGGFYDPAMHSPSMALMDPRSPIASKNLCQVEEDTATFVNGTMKVLSAAWPSTITCEQKPLRTKKQNQKQLRPLRNLDQHPVGLCKLGRN
jgi:hypothetical protein